MRALDPPRPTPVDGVAGAPEKTEWVAPPGALPAGGLAQSADLFAIGALALSGTSEEVEMTRAGGGEALAVEGLAPPAPEHLEDQIIRELRDGAGVELLQADHRHLAEAASHSEEIDCDLDPDL